MPSREELQIENEHRGESFVKAMWGTILTAGGGFALNESLDLYNMERFDDALGLFAVGSLVLAGGIKQLRHSREHSRMLGRAENQHDSRNGQNNGV